MRKVFVTVLLFTFMLLCFAGLEPNFPHRATRAIAIRRGPHAQAAQQSKRKHQLRVAALKPQGIPGSSGLIAIPQFTDDKQLINNGGPALIIPIKNTSPTNTITVSGITVSNTPTFAATTNCTTLAPGGNCTVTVTYNIPDDCATDPNTTIDLASNDPALGGSPLEIDIFDGFGSDGHFQINNLTNPAVTPTTLATQLAGSGVTVSNVTYTGADVAAGNFTTDTNIIGFKSGIVLSSGSVRNVAGPNCSSGIDTENQTAGDPDLDTILGAPGDSHDAAVLEFDFVPNTPVVSFQYVFASDEYNEFVGKFNDVFAFFVNGQNIALLPGVTPPTPVSINNVNLNVNPQFYINNDFQFPSTAPVDTEMDGLTVVLTATANVTAGKSNHIKLAIADALDDQLDSNVFIAAGSLTSSAVTLSPDSLSFGNQAVGTTSASEPVTMTNAGSAVVNIASIVPSTGFTQTNSCPTTLAPAGQTGSSCTIDVSFAPLAAGGITGALTVTDDSPTPDSQQTVLLSGTGTGTGAATHFLVTAPSTATAGTPFNFTVTAKDASNNTVTTYAGTVHFSSSDAQAILPANSMLTNGVGTFSATLKTNGGQTITATDTVTASVTGTSGTITVTAVSLTSIAVTPANATILIGQTLQYTATGTFSDNSTKDLTTQVTWGSSNPAAATISNAAGTQGLATAASSLSPAAVKSRAMARPAGAPVTQATTTISATLGEIQGSTTLTVTASPVIITVSPPPPGQPTVPVIDPGGAAVYGLVLTSQPGFSGTVTLSCTSSAPQFITCAPDPASVTIKPGGTTQVAIVLNTFCSRNAPLDMPVPGGPAGVLIVVLTALALASVTWMYRRRPRWVLTFAALTIALYSIVGCGSTPTGLAGRTPAGQYTLNLSFNVNGGAPIPVQPPLQLIVK